MTLNDIVSAFEPGIKVKVTETHNGTEKEMITFFSEGGTQLSATLLARTVDYISVYGKTSLCLHLSEST